MKKVLVITYYWPPSGGSGVQRWLFFSKYLSEFGIEPHILTVNPQLASYKFLDNSLEVHGKNINVYHTETSEPFDFYSKIIGKPKAEAVPQGFSGESNPGLIKKIARFVRGNFFIPDARKGWVPFAFEKAAELITSNKIDTIITTGPPHSTHLTGLRLKRKFNVKWIADFRDPWTDVYYNNMLYRTSIAKNIDVRLENEVLQNADLILTIGPGMVKILKEKLNKNGAASSGDKFHYILNGFDPDAFENIEVKKDSSRFTICHLGVLSNNQPINGFTEAMAKIAKEEPGLLESIRLKLIGKVSPNLIDDLRKQVPQLEIQNIDYLPHQNAMAEIVNSDLLFNSLAETKDAHYLISGKLMEYLATGNPILCLGDPSGDAASLLSVSDDAVVYDRNDVGKIYTFILMILRKWKESKSTSVKRDISLYSRRNTAKQLAQLINKL